ncbi:MAG: hypothetical protein IKG79_08790 [Neisseriaceae bacterium]|nr:hypothetical protein [Neisseriaceae bacterium]
MRAVLCTAWQSSYSEKRSKRLLLPFDFIFRLPEIIFAMPLEVVGRLPRLDFIKARNDSRGFQAA